ncbi:MAG: hypothetical protein FWE31_04570 [Firmicutes bacterium]|nr:hypothetical protein [Bacillota bacterium]
MDIKTIKKLGEIMNTEGLKTLEISDAGFSVRLERDTGISVLPQAKFEAFQETQSPKNMSVAERIILPRMKRITVPKPPATQKPAKTETKTSVETSPAPAAPKVFEIRSPIIGKFHARPSEDSLPFVIPGKKVYKGDVLCMIEVDNELNEITSELDGEIIDIQVRHGSMLAFDQIMFKIRA